MENFRKRIEGVFGSREIPEFVCLGNDLDPEDLDITPFFKGLKYDEVDLYPGLISENSPFEHFTNKSLRYYVASYYLMIDDVVRLGEVSWETSIYWLLEFFRLNEVNLLCDQSIFLFRDLLWEIIENRDLFKMVDDEPILLVLDKCDYFIGDL